jgi:hypothetical protein
LCQSRLSKLLDIAATRQRSGRLTFVVAFIGIVARQKLDRQVHPHRKTGRMVQAGRSEFKARA